MLSLPPSANLTLVPAGTLKLRSTDDLWDQLYRLDQPFTPATEPLVELVFDPGTTAQLQAPDSLSVDLGAGFSAAGSCSLQLFWPGQTRAADNPIDRFGVADQLTAPVAGGGQYLYAVVSLSGNAKASLTGNVPRGPLSATFGVEAGGDLAFTQLIRFNAADTARSIIGALFANGTLRLPQTVGQNKIPPAPGEVLALAYGGYLSLSSKITWGYSLARSRSFAVADLATSFNYSLKLAASAALAYRLAGHFSIEARAGARPGWARVAVRRHADDSFSFTADLGLDAAYTVPGLADQSFEDVLRMALGVDAASLAEKLEKALALTDPKALRQQIGDLAYAWCESLVQPLYGELFGNTTVKDLVAKLGATARRVAALDQQVAALFQQYVGGTFASLGQKLDELLTVDDLALHLGLADSDTWRLLDQLFGDKLQTYLHDGAPFVAIKDKLRELKALLADGPASEIAQWLKTTEQQLGLANLLTQLKALNSAADLQTLTDEKLKALVGEFVGQAFDDIARNATFAAAFAELAQVRQALDRFHADWKAALAQVAAQKFSAELVYRYSQSGKKDRLVDLSVNLAHPQGPALFDLALRGDFLALMASTDPTLVELHAGTIERETVAASDLHLTLFGSEQQSVRTLTQDSKLTLETGPNGLVALYASKTMVEEKRRRGTAKWSETQWSSFTLQAAGEVARGTAGANLLRTLSTLGLAYALKFDDSSTTYDELAEYLRLCELLRLGPPVADYLAHLRASLGTRPLGKVSVAYTVTYAPGALAALFHLPTQEIVDFARQTRREFYRSYYLASGDPKGLGSIGLAYADQAFHDQVAADLHAGVFQPGNPAYRDAVFKFKNVAVPPAWNGGVPGKRSFPIFYAGALITQILAERAFLPPLAAFDQLFDAFTAGVPVPVAQFEQRAHDLVAAKQDADTFAEKNYSPFFAILDALIAHATNGRSVRKSSLRITLTPPGSAEPINQFLSA